MCNLKKRLSTAESDVHERLKTKDDAIKIETTNNQ